MLTCRMVFSPPHRGGDGGGLLFPSNEGEMEGAVLCYLCYLCDNKSKSERLLMGCAGRVHTN